MRRSGKITRSENSAAANQRPFSLEWERIESLRADGLDDLLIQDWSEIETDLERRPYDPDWERLRVLERQGYFVTLAARVGREIVGFNAFYVMPDIQSRRVKQAVNQVIWAVPEWRARIGLALIAGAEEPLRKMGAWRITYACKTHLHLLHSASGGRLGQLLALRGYHQIESVYAKTF